MKFGFAILAAIVLCQSAIAAEIDFSHDVAPILKRHCSKCHMGNEKKGGLSLNTRESLLAGGESAKGFVEGKSGESEIIQRIESDNDDLRMPPEGTPVPAAEIATLKKWIDSGAPWQDGFTFGKRGYEAPLKPRRPEVPPSSDGREDPIDRIIDAYQSQQGIPRPKPIDDATFARRAYLDIIGLLPTPAELESFQGDSRPDKRTQLAQALLGRNVDYTEHWLTFWNDLLRNDYSGTGFITGGRKQISKWLYESLVTNKPYDQFARELIAPPTAESAGFGEGIRWRGEVSAGQTVEIQFAQSMAQSFLGINLKCASCHDSFVDRWTLEESYGLAAIFSTRTLDIHRCDQPTGKTAAAAWLFPEIGQVDPKASQPERLGQLAQLMTHAENGRFARTIVNRIWHRLMGRGVIHPLDAMQNEPWNADLLDYLAMNLVDHKYDLKQTIELITTSQAYQSQIQPVETSESGSQGYRFTGPLAKRLTAEQFIDAVWQLTETAPTKFDAPVVRGEVAGGGSQKSTSAKWIWSRASTADAAAGETVVFRKQWELASMPQSAIGVVACDNSYVLYANGKQVHAGNNWEVPDSVSLLNQLTAGKNEILIVAKNGGSGPNPAGLFFEARLLGSDGKSETIATDDSWQWTSEQPAANGTFKKEPSDWKPAAAVAGSEVWSSRIGGDLAAKLDGAAAAGGKMVRASLLKGDFLMRSLGRPNRDQIVSVRPEVLTTLEAIDLSNGETLAAILAQGSQKLQSKGWKSPAEFSDWLYHFALSRPPSDGERQVMTELLGDKLTEQSIQDALWAVCMLPEFQLVR
jgi:hypothetical protein